jgi:3-oxoacyl-[acyl-carrier protein] reductase
LRAAAQSPRVAALVTGAGRGIGRAIAVRLARDGFAVALNDLAQLDGACAAADQIRRAGGRSAVCPGDVSEKAAAAAIVAAAESSLGPVGVLVNNAALTEVHTRWTDITQDDWDRVMAVNARGPFLMARAAYPAMRELGWGRIVNISSAVVRAGMTGLVHYAASKAALVGLTRSLARELAQDGITVNAVAPGAIVTESERAIVRDQAAADADMLAKQAVQRRGLPDDVVGVVSFLATEDAGFLTGQTIAVDGGWTMR